MKTPFSRQVLLPTFLCLAIVCLVFGPFASGCSKTPEEQRQAVADARPRATNAEGQVFVEFDAGSPLVPGQVGRAALWHRIDSDGSASVTYLRRLDTPGQPPSFTRAME